MHGESQLLSSDPAPLINSSLIGPRLTLNYNISAPIVPLCDVSQLMKCSLTEFKWYMGRADFSSVSPCHTLCVALSEVCASLWIVMFQLLEYHYVMWVNSWNAAWLSSRDTWEELISPVSVHAIHYVCVMYTGSNCLVPRLETWMNGDCSLVMEFLICRCITTFR